MISIDRSGESHKRSYWMLSRLQKPFFFVSSIHSNSSINVIRELGYAVKQRKIIIPVLLDDTPYAKSIRLDISDIHQIGFKNDTNTEKELITSIIYAAEL